MRRSARQTTFPIDTSLLADTGLRCETDWVAHNAYLLRSRRSDLWKPGSTLAKGLQPVSKRLCRALEPTMRAVPGALAVAFVAPESPS